jgi:small subunit ribosomal protein S1
MEDTTPTLDVQLETAADAEPVEVNSETEPGPTTVQAEPLEATTVQAEPPEPTTVQAEPPEPTTVQAEPPEATAEAEPPATTDAAPEPEGQDQATMTDLVDEFAYQRPKRGEIRNGIILSIDPEEVIVDVGVKRDGIVPLQDLNRLSEEERNALSVGEEVPVYVLRPEDRDGNLLLSLFRARQEKDWRRAEEMLKNGDFLDAAISGYNKGGVVVPFGGIRGFVPASQINGFPRHLGMDERLQRLSELVGKETKLVVIEVDRRRRRLVLSERIASRRWRKARRKELLETLREGEVVTGTVSSLASFGAFADLGGADGLVHVSELAWKRVRHPREVVQVGQEVQVLVLRLDHKRQRIALSIKRLQPEPWATVEDRYELGQLVEGVVTNLTDFGAFAEVEQGVEGLIHISELAETNVAHPSEVVKRGDLLLLRIIRIDGRRRRMGLSLKRVLASEWTEWAAKLNAAREEEAKPPTEEVVEEPRAEADEKVPTPAAEEAAEPLAEVEQAEALPAADAEAAEPLAEVEQAEVLPAADAEAAEPLAEVEQAETQTPAEPEATEPPAEAEQAEPVPEAPAAEATPPDEADLPVPEDQALAIVEA